MIKKLTLGIGMCLLLAGCAKQTEQIENIIYPEGENTQIEFNELVLNENITFDDFQVKVLDYRISTYNEQDLLIIKYNLKNISDQPIKNEVVSFRAYQDKVSTELVEKETMDMINSKVVLQPGEEIENAQITVTIDDMSLPLELEVDEAFSFTNEHAYFLIMNLDDVDRNSTE